MKAQAFAGRAKNAQKINGLKNIFAQARPFAGYGLPAARLS